MVNPFTTGFVYQLTITFIMHFNSQCTNFEKVIPLWAWLLDNRVLHALLHACYVISQENTLL